MRYRGAERGTDARRHNERHDFHSRDGAITFYAAGPLPPGGKQTCHQSNALLSNFRRHFDIDGSEGLRSLSFAALPLGLLASDAIVRTDKLLEKNVPRFSSGSLLCFFLSIEHKSRGSSHLYSRLSPPLPSLDTTMSMKLMASASKKARKLHITSCTVITWSDVACSLQRRKAKKKRWISIRKSEEAGLA